MTFLLATNVSWKYKSRLLNWDKVKTPYLLLVGSIVLMIMFIDPSQIEAAR